MIVNAGPALRTLLILFAGLLAALPAPAQPAAEAPEETSGPAAERIDVDAIPDDAAIAARLSRILDATGWFRDPGVRVDEGIVFLTGRADSRAHREWALELAGRTEGVVAVVDRLEIPERSMWDLSQALAELRLLAADAIRNGPLIVAGLLFLVATWFVSKWSVGTASSLLGRRFGNPLLRDVIARAVAVPVFLIGLYLVLRIFGLSRLATTLLGGTGLVALVIGFAFRDIAENFLASILISVQHPFAAGDLIEVAGFKGYVQSVNTRSTLLMTLEGNHVQIPNATIYKETITNFTANPNARFDFTVGIGYDDSIAKAQSVALSVLTAHPAVVDDPEPLILVESLGPATVNLRVYFWINIARYSQLKVRSAVIRLTKRAFSRAGISMPDEAREIIFPAGVPVRILRGEEEEAAAAPAPRAEPPAEEDADAAHTAEGDLTSEAEEIGQQARRSRVPESGQNLLE